MTYDFEAAAENVAAVAAEHAIGVDVEAAFPQQTVDAARKEVYQQLKNDFGRLAFTTVSVGQVQTYRKGITDLVFELMASGNRASDTTTKIKLADAAAHVATS